MLTSRVLLSGRYELDERIGAGGYSEVWRAADLTLARPVAVKVLYAGFAQRADTLARFRAEARHAGRLSQENIARVYDYVEPAGGCPPFLVMELIDGPSLAGVLLDGPLGPAAVAAVIAQAAAGLQAAHRAGLVHRDIKPGNLLVSPDGTVKVADFGISHAVGSEALTGTGLLLGTAGYLAPERVAGGPATPASDLYGLGVVAWECLTGRMPFTGSALEVALAHRDQNLPPLPAGTPPALADLIAELTARNPCDRPASASAVAGRARELAGPAGVRAGSPGGRPAPAAPAGQPSDWRALPVTDQLAPRPAGAGSPAAGHGPGGPQAGTSAGGWRRPRRVLAGATAVVAMLAGLVTASQVGPLAPPRVTAKPSARPLPRATGPQLITVSAVFLDGHSVTAVAARLRRAGLRVRVRWQVSLGRPPGTVVSVSPEGYRPAGSLVTVVGARAPAAQASAQVAAAGADPGPGPGPGPGKGPEPGKGPGPGKGSGHGKGPGRGNGNGDGGGGGD
jgi:serine/threonine-protein kinase